ncbi:hypothetical protein [Devosia ginsengisoli]|uniref:hypothetical protein n=1 Tax=Devosia ginsengisoli TaxID=400770 RepID=UPI0026F12AB5|nr:hypothetical protein [Devosia ginsengisoli]MCR6673620.1 hypothetical protein [Devosia ginsengisoli]
MLMVARLTEAAVPSVMSDRTRSEKVTVVSLVSPSSVVVAERVISGMVMLVAVRPASASALSTSSPLKMARRVASSTLESTASMVGMSTVISDSVAMAVVAGGVVPLSLTFWAQALPAGRATLMRQAVARMARRCRDVVLNGVIVFSRFDVSAIWGIGRPASRAKAPTSCC